MSYPPHLLMDLEHIYIAPPIDAADALLRELVGPPDYDKFDLAPCKTGHLHAFVMNVGRVVSTRVATWDVLCRGVLAVQCTPQRGTELPIDEIKKYWKLLADFKPRNGAVTQMVHYLGKIDGALEALSSLGESPALPPLAAQKMRHIWGGASDPFDEFNHADDIPPEKQELDIAEGKLEVVRPDGEEKEGDGEARLVRVVIYAVAEKQPFQAIFWAPIATLFKFDSYRLPLEVSAVGSSFFGYSTISGGYDPACIPVNMVGRGNFMVYRKLGLHRDTCPGLLMWEGRAAESAENDPRGNTLPPSSPPPRSPSPPVSTRQGLSSRRSGPRPPIVTSLFSPAPTLSTTGVTIPGPSTSAGTKGTAAYIAPAPPTRDVPVHKAASPKIAPVPSTRRVSLQMSSASKIVPAANTRESAIVSVDRYKQPVKIRFQDPPLVKVVPEEACTSVPVAADSQEYSYYVSDKAYEKHVAAGSQNGDIAVGASHENNSGKFYCGPAGGAEQTGEHSYMRFITCDTNFRLQNRHGKPRIEIQMDREMPESDPDMPELVDSDGGRFLAKAIPIPQELHFDCPEFFRHTFDVTLGAQKGSRADIGRVRAHCKGHCPDRRSHRFPPHMQAELHSLMTDYTAVQKRLASLQPGDPDFAGATKEYNALQRRRDTWGVAAARREQEEGAQRQRERVEQQRKASGKRKALSQADDEEVALNKAKKARVAPQDKGKAKAANDVPAGTAAEQDEYDPKIFETDPAQARTVELIVYMADNPEPIQRTLELRHGGHLNLASFDIAVTVKALTAEGDPGLDYDWFCVFKKDFVLGAFLKPINMLSRGTVLVCRSATTLEVECAGIQDCINKVFDSLLGVSEAYGFDGDLEDCTEIDPTWAPSPASIPGPAPFPSSASGGAGPGPSSLAVVAAAERRRDHQAATAAEYVYKGLDNEDVFWEREEAEKKAMANGAAKIKREIIEIED
ncbi:hypothetical protein DFH09DRAFT_1336281 [Mycena vulgaris]|nr:hypothetical protein DFH09DRAFT_1336281 [Mycena vulgaris]